MKRKLYFYIALILSVMLICISLFVPASAVDDPVTAGNAIANGTWYCSVVDFGAPSGPYWTGSGYDCYPQSNNTITINNNYGLIPYAIYTKLDDLTPNTTYIISFNYSVQGGLDASNTGVILNKDNKYSSIKWQDNRIDKVNNTVYGLATDDAANKKATITFTTDDNTDYILSLKANWISSNITYSNFTLTKGEVVTPPEQPESDSIANGYWKNGLGTDTNSKDNYGNYIFKRGKDSLTIPEGYYANWAIYTCLNLEPNTNYEISFNYTHIEAESCYILLDNNNSAGPIFYNANDPQYVNPGANTVIATASNDAINKKITFTFATDDNTKYYFVLKGKYAPGETEVFSNFEVKTTAIVPDTTLTGEKIAKGTWWCSVVNCFNYTGSDVYFSGSGYGYYPQGKNSVSINADVTPWAIYTRLDGLEKNTIYEISFDYNVKNGLDAHNSGVILNEGVPPIWQDNRINLVDNKLYGTVEDDKANQKAKVLFITDENTDYFLSIKANIGSSPVTLSNFEITSEPANLTKAEIDGSKVVAGKWTARYYGTVDYKNITTRTITARDVNYHWVIGLIDELTIGTTYKLTFKDDLDSLNGLYALPANENAIGENDAVINANGSYMGLYRNNAKDYAFVTKNPQTKEVSVIFTANATKYHIFISHGEATTASYSDFKFQEFNELNFKNTSIYNQSGLRFEFEISKALQDGYQGQKVVEYGIITAVTEDLRNMPLVINSMEAVGMARVKRAIAFSVKNNINNIYFEDPSGNKTFTAIIENIPSSYSEKEFSARAYFILEDGSIVYGATATCSLANIG